MNTDKFYQEVEAFAKEVIANRGMSSYFKKCAKTRYGIPEWISLDWLNTNPSMFNTVDFYCLVTCLDDTALKYERNKNFSKFFSEEEAKGFMEKIRLKAENKNKEKNKIYPLIFDNCLRVNDDQWVTAITAKQLEQLEKDNVIYYNKNTQREMTRKVISGTETYTITLKKKAVNEIARDMEHGLFISNAITLNINEDDTETEFEYDDTTSQIIITKGKLDIIDGYHRFRAMMKNMADIDNFDYPMILNIVAFSEEKANRYIVQEDKRNKISSGYLKSVDSLNVVSQLLNRINTTTGCTYGKLGRDDEENKISQNQFHQWITKCLDIRDKKDIITYKNIFIEIFNGIDEKIGDIGKLTFCQLGIVVACVSKHQDNPEFVNELIVDILSNYDFDEKKFSRKVVNKRSIEAINSYINEREKAVCDYV